MQRLRFIDLFAGIGGFHQALTQLDMDCVFASEKDQYARKTYLANHPIREDMFNDDIRSIAADEVPDHDILCAGFPCQPFSQAGYKRGFDDGHDSERGNLFYCILDILVAKRPKAFILENVRHLLNHDNGNTFKVIYDCLTEAGYSVHYKVLKASEYGLPQLRPRIFLVGFEQSQVNTFWNFVFPPPIPLKFTMSDVWEGDCEREIGFTLRVGGRGSNINDRRNWDHYRVNGEIKRLEKEQGVRMMGLPDDFTFPVTKTQAMKQLGNSVCVDVVYHVAFAVKAYLSQHLKSPKNQTTTIAESNQDEWGEFYTFLQLLFDTKHSLGNEHESTLSEFITVFKVKHNRSQIAHELSEMMIELRNLEGDVLNRVSFDELKQQINLERTLQTIKTTSGRSFTMPKLADYFKRLTDKFKGSSQEKTDLFISFNKNNDPSVKHDAHINSELGHPSSQLNASSATNFVFEVAGFKGEINDINDIKPPQGKVQARLKRLHELGCSFKFVKCEKPAHEVNLRKVDSQMPEMLATLLLNYYQGQGSDISHFVTDEIEICRFKNYLKATMLGMFYRTNWDGICHPTGSILVTHHGDLVLYHIIKERQLKDFLFQNTTLDTPSTRRHRFGTIFFQNRKVYIKLNLQIRFKNYWHKLP